MTLTNAPDLTTGRLILRGPEKGDLAPYTAFIMRNPMLAALGETCDAADAWYRFLTGVGHWHWHGFGFFTLTLRDDPEPLGRVGLLNHVGTEDIELAWHLFDGHEDKGFATEAAIAVRDWARRTLGIDRLVSYIHTTNAPSQRVARRLGAATDGTRAAHEPDAEVWVHPKAAA